jgi:hypothetical protein
MKYPPAIFRLTRDRVASIKRHRPHVFIGRKKNMALVCKYRFKKYGKDDKEDDDDVS